MENIIYSLNVIKKIFKQAHVFASVFYPKKIFLRRILIIGADRLAARRVSARVVPSRRIWPCKEAAANFNCPSVYHQFL